MSERISEKNAAKMLNISIKSFQQITQDRGLDKAEYSQAELQQIAFLNSLTLSSLDSVLDNDLYIPGVTEQQQRVNNGDDIWHIKNDNKPPVPQVTD
jgi:hypothetical protein